MTIERILIDNNGTRLIAASKNGSDIFFDYNWVSKELREYSSSSVKGHYFGHMGGPKEAYHAAIKFIWSK